ncbi:hypothetical protein CYMTET_51613, partial [Cymbomonas tetramitiformis]
LVRQLQRTCCVSQEAFLFTQMVLSHLAERPSPGSAAFRRLMQELEATARMDHGHAMVRLLSSLYVSSSRNMEGQALVAEITSSPQLQAPVPPLGISRLHGLFMSEDPPSIVILRDPLLIQKLLSELFMNKPRSGSSAAQAQHRDFVLQLLSWAAAAEDSTAEGLSTVHVEAARVAVQTAMEYASALNQATVNVQEQEEEAVLQMLQVPMAAAGILMWLGSRLSDPSSYSSSERTPLYLYLLHAIPQLHPLQYQQVLEVLLTAFSTLARTKLGLQTQMLDIVVALIRMGYADAVLQFADKWLEQGNPDPSLVRYFAAEVLKLAMPPFSLRFVRSMLSLMQAGGGGVGANCEAEPLIVFKEHCTILAQEDGQLTSNELDVLSKWDSGNHGS